MPEGRWQHTVGTDLLGATLGLAGLGRIGHQMARIGQAFEMDVIAWSQHLDPAVAAAAGVRAVSKADLFGAADVVSVHLVLSDRTRGLVTEQDLRSMKPTAYLVNTSRGPIIDSAALLRALTKAGSPARAWTCTTPSHCPRTTRSGTRRGRCSPRTSGT